MRDFETAKFYGLALVLWSALGRIVLAQDLPSEIRSLSEASKCVGKVLVTKEGYVSTGTGFLCDVDEGIFTNAHVIAGGSDVSFIPDLTGVPIGMVLHAAWPELDLVLLRPVAANAIAAAGMVPAKLARESPKSGLSVSSVGYPRGLGYSITQGVVSGIRIFQELPAEFQSGWDRSPDSRWIQTDCAINPGNSGGPLFDEQYQVVGINTWASRIDNDIYFALASSEVIKAVELRPEGTLNLEELAERDARVRVDKILALAPETVYAEVAYGPGGEEAPGYLELSTTPGTKVWIDGRLVGETSETPETLLVSGLPLGQRILHLDRPGFCPITRLLELDDNGFAKIGVFAEAEVPTSLNVTAFPGDCVVSIDGPVKGTRLAEAGASEFRGLPPGVYMVEVKQGAVAMRKEVQLDPASSARFTANFAAKTISLRFDEPIVLWINLADTGVTGMPSGEVKLPGGSGRFHRLSHQTGEENLKDHFNSGPNVVLTLVHDSLSSPKGEYFGWATGVQYSAQASIKKLHQMIADGSAPRLPNNLFSPSSVRKEFGFNTLQLLSRAWPSADQDALSRWLQRDLQVMKVVIGATRP